MSRKEELLALIPEESLHLVDDVIDQAVFLEEKLMELKKLPFIEVHPQQNSKQRSTPAAKQYKEFLQQYINCIKLLEYVLYKDKKLQGDEAEESPLRKWVQRHNADSI